MKSTSLTLFLLGTLFLAEHNAVATPRFMMTKYFLIDIALDDRESTNNSPTHSSHDIDDEDCSDTAIECGEMALDEDYGLIPRKCAEMVLSTGDDQIPTECAKAVLPKMFNLRSISNEALRIACGAIDYSNGKAFWNLAGLRASLEQTRQIVHHDSIHIATSGLTKVISRDSRLSNLDKIVNMIRLESEVIRELKIRNRHSSTGIHPKHVSIHMTRINNLCCDIDNTLGHNATDKLRDTARHIYGACSCSKYGNPIDPLPCKEPPYYTILAK